MWCVSSLVCQCYSMLAVYDMINLLTATGFTNGGSSTVHMYTQTVQRVTQNKQYIERHKN